MQTELAKFDSLRSKITTLLGPLKDLTVRDKVEHTVASGSLVTVKGLGKEIEALRVAAVSPLRDQVNAINARAKELTEPLDAAEASIKGKMQAFLAAENARIAERRREAAEQCAREEERLNRERREREEAAAAKAKAERERMDAEEKARQESLAAAKRAESAFGIEDQADIKKREEEAQRARQEDLRVAAELERRQRVENDLQREREERELELRRKSEEKSFAAQRPINTTTLWKFEVMERLEVPMEYWTIDEVKLGKAVRGGLREIPGVKIWSEQVVVAR